MTLYRLTDLFPDQLEERLKENPTLVLPFGTIEWHSYHLPLGLDGLVSEHLALGIAEKNGAVLAPVSYWAVGGVPYPYTLNLPIELVEPLVETVFVQFAAMGFKLIIAFTGHFGLDQTLALKRAAANAMDRTEATILPLTEYDPVTDLYAGDHAGIGETSLLWAERPDLIRLDAVAADTPLDGVIGADPRGEASAERGKRLGSEIVSRAAEMGARLLAEPDRREDYAAALKAAVAVLQKTHELRQVGPKSAVPPLATHDYLEHCEAMRQGRYSEGKQLALAKYETLVNWWSPGSS